jgi:hypothetical protein
LAGFSLSLPFTSSPLHSHSFILVLQKIDKAKKEKLFFMFLFLLNAFADENLSEIEKAGDSKLLLSLSSFVFLSGGWGKLFEQEKNEKILWPRLEKLCIYAKSCGMYERFFLLAQNLNGSECERGKKCFLHSTLINLAKKSRVAR